MSVVYDKVMEYKNKYSGTIAWRLKKHCKVIEDYINPDEEVLYAFCGQKNDCWYDITTSCVVVLTNKRLLIGQKRVVWGSFFTQITPDLYNDMKIPHLELHHPRQEAVQPLCSYQVHHRLRKT